MVAISVGNIAIFILTFSPVTPVNMIALFRVVFAFPQLWLSVVFYAFIGSMSNINHCSMLCIGGMLMMPLAILAACRIHKHMQKSNGGLKCTKLRLSLVLIATVVVVSTVSPIQAADYVHLKMGNPSRATEDARDKDNFLMEKEYFALSYNNTKGTPNWVSWQLATNFLGDAPRFPFHPDETFPRGFRHITPKDYTGSGFDRGHMCPHSDRNATPHMSQATFVMSNIIPQSPNVNQKAWAQLEMYCRNLVERHHKRLYILSGPAG